MSSWILAIACDPPPSPPWVPCAPWGLTTTAPSAFVVNQSTYVWPICRRVCSVSGPRSGFCTGWEPGALWMAGLWPHSPEGWDVSFPSPSTQNSYKHLGHGPSHCLRVCLFKNANQLRLEFALLPWLLIWTVGLFSNPALNGITIILSSGFSIKRAGPGFCPHH